MAMEMYRDSFHECTVNRTMNETISFISKNANALEVPW